MKTIISWFKRMNLESGMVLVLVTLLAVVSVCNVTTESKVNEALEPIASTSEPEEFPEVKYIFEQRYELTEIERREIASVITAEAIGEPYAGKVAVAQCILQACEDDNLRPISALAKYEYSKRRPEPCAEALKAVEAVFDYGHLATSEPIKYFYAPKYGRSSFHESQGYVMTINGHKFFKEAK